MRRHLRRLLFLIAAIGGAAGTLESVATSLPNEVSTRQPTSFELLRDGKPAGRLELAAGQKLAVIDVQERYVLARYRNLNGRVLASATDLPAEFIPKTAAPATTAPAKSAVPTTAAAPAKIPAPPAAVAAVPQASYQPANAMELALAGKLVALEAGTLRPFPTSRLAGVKFYAIYFSAGWCPPCREFTPEFMDAYIKLRSVYPEFEVILVNRDRSPAAMFEYMRDDQMKWPALRWDQIRGADKLNGYAGSGIPCLVLVDENGAVLSDSFRWGRYVGPDAVLDDTWKLLRDYRRRNPRAKT